ncbi:MAG TPA: hypothetical protein PLU24_03020 [Candidatus Omnitrophota bacterium]|nr:hypothetical protein [Candidatus Omnitrophota bacterium]
MPYNKNLKSRWCLNNLSLIIIFLFVGPLVLPFIWINNRFTLKVKIYLTLAITALCLIIGYSFSKYYGLWDQCMSGACS